MQPKMKTIGFPRSRSFLEKLRVCSALLLKADRKHALLFYSFFAVYTALTLLEPYGLREIINRLGGGLQGIQDLLPALGFLLGNMLLRQLTGTTELLARTRLQDSVPPVYEVELINKVQTLSLEQVEDARVQDLLFKSKRLNLFKAAVNTYSVLLDAASLLVIFVLLLKFGTLLAAAVVPTFSALQVYAQTFQTKKTEDLARSQGSEHRFLDRLFRLGLERESNMEIRVLGANDYLLNRWKKQTRHLASVLAAHETKAAFKKVPAVLVYFLIQSLLAVFVGWVVVREGNTVGDFVFLFTLVNLFSELATGFSSKLNTVIRDSRIAEDLLQFLKLSANHRPVPKREPISESRALVELRNVSYRYPSANAPALQDVNLTLYEGETLAIIGEMGSGKSTLVKVLTGLVPTETGEVIWNTQAIPPDSLSQNSVTSVFQDYIRYHMTTRENIGLGHTPDLENTTKMTALLQDLGLPDDPEFLQQQLGTVFGGIDLSGGQWQRVAIARALMKPHQLITFDEPTSALDPLAELELIRLFLTLTQNQTKLIVTHRLAAAKQADRAIVLYKGQIIEIGTHDELMSQDTRYRELFESQAKWYA